MTRIHASFLIALLSLASAVWSQVAAAGDDVEKTVAALEQQWLESQRANNPDLVAPLLAGTVILTNSEGGTMGKTEFLASEKAIKYTSVDYTDVKVTAYGDTAIATGILTSKGTDASGKPLDSSNRFTDTWVKMADGKWQCVASHTSSLKS